MGEAKRCRAILGDRWGKPTKLTPPTKAPMTPLPAVVAYIGRARDGSFLATSGRDSGELRAPTGEVGLYETLIDALARIVLEKTGLKVTASKEIHRGRFGSEGRTFVTFLCSVEGEIEPEEGARIEWVLPEHLAPHTVGALVAAGSLPAKPSNPPAEPCDETPGCVGGALHDGRCTKSVDELCTACGVACEDHVGKRSCKDCREGCIRKSKTGEPAGDFTDEQIEAVAGSVRNVARPSRYSVMSLFAGLSVLAGTLGLGPTPPLANSRRRGR